MRAVILAAGVGQRLGLPDDAAFPKCLLNIGGVTLLERHLRLLRAVGVEEIVIATGYLREQIAAELDRLDWQPRPTLIHNPDFRDGSVRTVDTVAEAMCAGGDVLLMDADVLYDLRILAPLVHDASVGEPHANRLLLDAAFEPGDEPVKLCLRAGRPVELRKRVAPDLVYDRVGESVGFFRFTEQAARRLAAIARDYVESGRAGQPHEEAVRDLLQEPSGLVFEVADVSAVPWMEIDFPADVERARQGVLPQLQSLE